MDPDPNGMAEYQLLGDGFGYHSYGQQPPPQQQSSGQQPAAGQAPAPGHSSSSLMAPNMMPSGQGYPVPVPTSRYGGADPSKGMLHSQYPFGPTGQPPPQMAGISGQYPPDPHRSFPGMSEYHRPGLNPQGHMTQMTGSSSQSSAPSAYPSRLMPGQFSDQRSGPPGLGAGPRAPAPIHPMGGQHQSYGYPATSAPPGYGHPVAPGPDHWSQSQAQLMSQRSPHPYPPYPAGSNRPPGPVPGFPGPPDQYNSQMHQLQNRPYFTPPAGQAGHPADSYPQSGFPAPGPGSSSRSSRSGQQPQPPQQHYPFPAGSGPPPSPSSSRYPSQYSPYGQPQQPFSDAARMSPYGLPPGIGPNSPGYRQPYPSPAPASSQMSPRRPTPTPPAGSPHQPPTSRTPDRVVSATTVSISQTQADTFPGPSASQLSSSSSVSPSNSNSAAPPSNSLAQLEQLVVSGSGLPMPSAPSSKTSASSSTSSSSSFYNSLPAPGAAPNVYSHFPSPNSGPGQHGIQSSSQQQQPNYYYQQQQSGSSWPASQSGPVPPSAPNNTLPGSNAGPASGFPSMRSPQQPAPTSSAGGPGLAKSPLNSSSQFSTFDNTQYNSPASDNFSGNNSTKQPELTPLSSMQKFDAPSSYGSPVTPSHQQTKPDAQDGDVAKEEVSKESDQFADSRNQPSPGSSFYGSVRSSSSVENSNTSSSVAPDPTLKKSDSINSQSSTQSSGSNSAPTDISYMTRPYGQVQNDHNQQSQYMNQQMYPQSQQSYSQFGNSYSDNFDMSSSGMNDQPVMTQMGSYGPPQDQRMYDQGYGSAQGMENMMPPPAPHMSGEYGSDVGDMGMPYQPSPYDEPFSSEPPTKKKGKGRPKKDPAEPKKEKKQRQPRAPKSPRGRGRGGRANMGDRMPAQAMPPDYPDSGYGPMSGGPMDGPVPDMYTPPHIHPPPGHPHSLPPHMSSVAPQLPPHDPFRNSGQMIPPPPGPESMHPAHHPGPGPQQPGMCLPPVSQQQPQPPPLQSHMEQNSFDGLGQPAVPVPVSSSPIHSMPPVSSTQIPASVQQIAPTPDLKLDHSVPAPPVETLLGPVVSIHSSTPSDKSSVSVEPDALADQKVSDSKANDSADGANETATEKRDDKLCELKGPDEEMVACDREVQSTGHFQAQPEDSVLSGSVVSQDSQQESSQPSPVPGQSPNLMSAPGLEHESVPVAMDEETAVPEPSTKRKGKKRKTKSEKAAEAAAAAADDEEVAEPPKKGKRSGGKKKKKVDPVISTEVSADVSMTTAAETTLDTEVSSIPDEADASTATASGAFDEATQEGDTSLTGSSANESTSKGKKGKGKGTPKGPKKPKLKEGKSSVKKKLPKIALAKFKGRKKKRLGSSEPNSDIEKTPPPSPDETESGVLKRRSGRVTKRAKYLDEVDLDLSGDDNKEEEKKEVPTVVVDDTMVVEKIMCMRTGTRELEPENEEEEAQFKEGKPPTVEVEEYYVKYKSLSYLHCDWRTEEELEKGDKRINQKIKRFKMKKDSNTSYDFLDDEPFNPDYCEVDRILDVNIVTEEIPAPPSPTPEPVAAESSSEEQSEETEAKVTSDPVKESTDDKETVPETTSASTDEKKDVADPPASVTDSAAKSESVPESELEEKKVVDLPVESTSTPANESESEKKADDAETEQSKPETVTAKPVKTITRTVHHYLVKWQALPYEESTWELEDDLDPEKVKQFWKFRELPPKEQLRHKKKPKPEEWKKLDASPVYKNGNTLREYQLEGLNWLTFCWYKGRNCILADEMGLGKTIQSLTFINEMVKYGIRSPFLIIAPLSTIGNWQREFETWTDLNVITYHGSAPSRNMITEYEMFYKNEKGEKMEGVYKFQVMITTFEVVLADCLELREIVWRACIIDEAHRRKNRNCKLLQGLRELRVEHRVLLTGTPLQNNVEELFSLLNFLEPSQFPSLEAFLLDFGDLKTADPVEKLQAILRPMMLRRLKEDVEKSLAPKEETIIEVELTNIQKKYYRAILERNFQFLSKGGTYANMPNLMNTMMELRKCCIHPFLINSAEEQITADFKQQYANDSDGHMKCMVQASGKLVLIDKLLPRLRADGHRVLIFSQMVRCLDILEDYVIHKKYPYERIDGRVRGNMRQAAIDRFSKPGSDRFVFLLCTRAGGLGINLTAADTVIIFDSDWNPQNDLQAQARCHRIGQSKMVKVYRLICRNTYEREMFDKASLKLGLDKAVLQSMNTGQKAGTSGGEAGAPLSKKEVEELLRKGAYGAVMDDDNAGDKFCEEDIDQILTRRTQVITIESGEKGSSFSRASFATSDNADIEIDDPNFWEKWAKKANIDSEELSFKNELIVQEPRRRTQTKRFGQDDGVMEMSEADSSDDDEDNISGRTRGGRGRPPRGKKGRKGRGNREEDEEFLGEFGPGNWARSECYKVEKALLTFGWGRWEEFVAMGNFRRNLSTQDVEDIARVLLLFALHNYKGDEKVKTFIFDLITPQDQVDKTLNKSPGSCSPTGRGRKGRKSARKPVTEELSTSDWASSDTYNPELLLLDEQYRKHLLKQINKLLLRVKLLYYLANEIIGDFRDDVLRGVPVRDIPIPHTGADGDPPAEWWDEECDKSLLIGVFKHGYDRYNLMRQDTNLCFYHRCGPPDGAALLAEIQDDDVGRLEEDEDNETTPATPATQDSSKNNSESDQTGEVTPETSGRLPFPSRADMNQRLRRIVTAFQKHSKRQEVRLAQQARHQQRLEKLERFEAAIKERELKKRETAQWKWSRREEADFYRIISSYGVEYDRKTQQFDWNKFRVMSRLEKKVDETLTEYYKAFIAMCKRVTGRRLSEEEENVQISVEPITDDRAARCLARIDLMRKIREDILPSPELDDKLQLCQPSIDLPDWWQCGRHDKDLLIGAAKYGLNRLDQSLMHDPELSFQEIIKNAEAEAKKLEAMILAQNEKEAAVEPLPVLEEKDVKPAVEKDEEVAPVPAVDAEVASGKPMNGNSEHAKEEEAEVEEVKPAATEDQEVVEPTSKTEPSDEKEAVKPSETVGPVENGDKSEEKSEDVQPVVNENTSEKDKSECEDTSSEKPTEKSELVDSKEKADADAAVDGEAPVVTNGGMNGHLSNISSPGPVVPEAEAVKPEEKAAEAETDETEGKADESDPKVEPTEPVPVEAAVDEVVKNKEETDEEVKSSEEPVLPPAATKEDDKEPKEEKPEELPKTETECPEETEKPDVVKPAPAVPLPVKAVRWPKDRVLQMRLEQIVYCFEKNEWPSMRHSFFSSLTGPTQSTPSVATADSSPRAASPGSLSLSSASREPTPHPTPDHTPRRELSPLPEYLFDNTGDSMRRRKRRRRRVDPEAEKRMKLRNLLTQNMDQQLPFSQQQVPMPGKNKQSLSGPQSAQSILNQASSFLPPNFFSSLPFVNSLRSELRNDFLSDEKAASLLLGGLSRTQAQAMAQMATGKHGHSASHTQGSAPASSGPPPAHQSSSKRNVPSDSLDLRFGSNPLLSAPPAPAHKTNPKLTPHAKSVGRPPAPSPVAAQSVLDLSSGPSLPKRSSRSSLQPQPMPSPPLPPQPPASGTRTGKRIGSRLDAIALNLQAKKMLEEKVEPKDNLLASLTSSSRKTETRRGTSSSSGSHASNTSSRLEQLQAQLLKKTPSGPPAAHSASTSKSLSGMNDLLSKSLSGVGLGFGNLFETGKSNPVKGNEASAILEQANAMKQNLNNWLESHPEFVRANPDLAAAAAAAMAFSPLPSGMPANTELLELPEGRRRGRRPKAETQQPASEIPKPVMTPLPFDDTVPVIHRQTGKRLSGHRAPSLQNLAEWLDKNPGYEIDPKWSPLSGDKFTNFKVPTPAPQTSGIRTRTSDRNSNRSSSTESSSSNPNSGSSSSNRRTTAASLLAQVHNSNNSGSVPTSNAGFGFPATSLASGLAGLNPNFLSGFPGNMNMKMFLDSMAAVSNPPVSSASPASSSAKTSTAQTSGSGFSPSTTSTSSSSQQNPLSSFFPFAGLAGIAGLQNPLLGFPGLNFPGYPGLGSFGDDVSKAMQDQKSTKGSSSKSSQDKKGEKGKNSNSGLFGSPGSGMGSSAMPFLYPNPNLLYSGLGLGGFSGLPSSSPFASLAQSGLMNGLGNLSGSSQASPSSTSAKSAAASATKSKSSSRSSSGAPSGLSLSTASSLLSSTGIHPSSAAVAAAMGDSDDESLKSLMGHDDDDDDLNGDLDDMPSKDDSDSDYEAKPKRKNKSKADLNRGRKATASSKASKT